MKTDSLLFIDIETVPQVEHFSELPEVLQKLWARKSSMIAPGELPSTAFEDRGGIYAEFGKVICIGLGYFVTDEHHGLQVKVKTLASDNERELLEEFIMHCNQFFRNANRCFCGHNIKEFDLPYLCRRLLIHGFSLPKGLSALQTLKPWENPVLDTMQYWKFGEYKNFTSVELLSSILDIPSPKDDIDGSEVAFVYWKEKNLDRIIKYCSKDIVTVAQLYLRLHGLPLLPMEQIVLS